MDSFEKQKEMYAMVGCCKFKLIETLNPKPYTLNPKH